MKQIDRLLQKACIMKKGIPVVGIFRNLPKREFKRAEKCLRQENPGRDVIAINIIPAKKPKRLIRA